MTERPILFSPPMVRAILAGSKTQTRRVVRDQPQRGSWPWPPMSESDQAAIVMHCPYGQPGDRLWVKETYWRDEEDGALLYAANPDDFELVNHNKRDSGLPKYNWRPSIFMPRWASRMTLEVTGVRVERLQDISEADAIAEGVDMQLPVDMPFAPGLEWATVTMRPRSAREAYIHLWNSINAKRVPWASNPWIWVLEFRRVKP